MAQQPPARPWFRLASMARPPSAPTPAPAPAPAPPPPAPQAPQPRPPFVRPTFTQTFVTPAATQPPQPTPSQEPPPPSAPQVPTPPSPPPPTQAPAPPPLQPRQPTPPPSPAAPAPPSPPPPMAPPKPSPTSTLLESASSSMPRSPKPGATMAPPPTSPPPPRPSLPAAAPEPPPPIILVAVPTTTMTARVPTPTPFPKIGESKPLSPPPKLPSPQIARPPSPLILPPPQLESDMEHHPNIPPEAEQKTILVQETVGTAPKVYVTKDRKQDLTRDNQAKEKDNHYKKLSDSEEFGMRVITIAGENRGVIMELGGGSRPPGLHMKGYPRGGGKLGNEGGNSSNEEGRIRSKDKSDKTMAPVLPPPLKAYTNSNVQGVNNSILLNSTCTHHDPGVHLSLSRKANGGGGHGIHTKDSTKG